jgi:chromosome partitioning protein
MPSRSTSPRPLLAMLAKPAWLDLQVCPGQPSRHGKPWNQLQPAWLVQAGWIANPVLPDWPLACHAQITMLVAFTNTKGGVGKSTLASHLAIWLYDQGYRVALLDTDEQQTAARWVKIAEPKITVAVATDVEAIQKERGRLVASHEIVVADSPGSGGEASHTITLLADLAVIPLQPSKPDVREIKGALKFVRLAQEMSGGLKPQARLVLTFTAKGDVQTRRLRADLAQFGVPVAKSEIRRLNAVRDACDTAVSRIASPDAMKAASDMDALFRELLGELLAKLPRDQSLGQGKEAANG